MFFGLTFQFYDSDAGFFLVCYAVRLRCDGVRLEQFTDKGNLLTLFCYIHMPPAYECPNHLFSLQNIYLKCYIGRREEEGFARRLQSPMELVFFETAASSGKATRRPNGL